MRLFIGTTTRNLIEIVILAILLLVPYFMTVPNNRTIKPVIRSSELTPNIITEGDEYRVEYVDEDGQITFAADLGYATMKKTKTETGVLETHFDEAGNPIPFKSKNYYAILRGYDEQGNNDRITFLDANGKPTANDYGYATTLCSFSDDGLLLMQQYLDENGESVCSSTFGFAKSNDYDENGYLIKQTFLDDRGVPMITEMGYASVTYTYYDSAGPEKGQVNNEFYFDEKGNPVSLPQGQFGLHKEYDEYKRTNVMTYLNAEGQPMTVSKGYATIVLSYFVDNQIASERYFNELGAPACLSEGQFGIEFRNGKVYYLDAEGHQQFNLMRLLLNHQFLVILAAIIAVIISILVQREMAYLFMIAYCGFIVFATLMFRETGSSKINFELFGDYRRIFTSPDARSNIMNNIWLFAPLGSFLYRIYPRKKVLLIPVMISIAIEVIQYLTGRGLCELEDVINNGLGAIIGYCIGKKLACWSKIKA